MNLFDLNRDHFGVGLRGLEMPVAQKLLDIADIGPVGEQVGGAGASQRVGRYGLFDPGRRAVFSQGPAQAPRCHGSAGVEQKQPALPGAFARIVGPDLF
jgi:hypothetical protein